MSEFLCVVCVRVVVVVQMCISTMVQKCYHSPTQSFRRVNHTVEGSGLRLISEETQQRISVGPCTQSSSTGWASAKQLLDHVSNELRTRVIEIHSNMTSVQNHFAH